MKYEAVIGLEVHVQLKTESKIFCGCATAFGAEPNTHVCPVCLGYPGVLPVLNEAALELTLKAGLMIGCRVAERSRFARKNYFYPDLPKNYQISQYELPLCVGGSIEIEMDGERKRIRITRAHLEEDAGKLIHAEGGRGDSSVDFNRTGHPLLEIVSEPDISSPEEAFTYLKELKLTLQYAGVSDCDMEKGSLRCDANVSLRPRGASGLGVKAEVKNLNSFRAVQKALAYEIERQAGVLDEGGRVLQETRLWDEDKGMTRSMRSKEESHDYRYFPEPDLVPIAVGRERVEELCLALPEAPLKRRDRFVEEYGIPSYDTEVLTAEKTLADYFEACVEAGAGPKAASNMVMGELLRMVKENGQPLDRCRVRPRGIAGLIGLVDDGTISATMGKDVLEEMFSTGKEAREIVEGRGLAQISDTAELEKIADEVIADNPKPAADYREGKKKAIGFLMGQVMKATRGTANPTLVSRILRSKLDR